MKMQRLFLVFCIICVMSTGIQIFAQESEDLMDLSLADLLNMEVTIASKSAEKLSDAPGVITVVTKDELERFGGTTLKDILERVPSLTSSTGFMTDRSIISVRGDQFKCTGSHILLLINGRPIREVQEGGIITETLESFPINIIERIEVIRGPGSVLYGSGAFSGVINIITKKAEKNDIIVTGLGGVPSAYNTLGEARCQLGDLGIVGAGKYHKKADWETIWDYAGPTGVVSNKVNIPSKGPGAYLGMNYKNLSLISSYNQWVHSYFIPDIMLYGNAYWKKGFADLGYGLKVNEKWNMDFNFTYTRSTYNVDKGPHSINIERDSYELIAECANFIKPIEKLNIVIGGLYNQIKGKELLFPGGASINVPISDDQRKSFGFYTQADYWLLQDMIKLISGLQANKVENVKLDIVPRAGLILYPVSYINVKALYSQAFRAPSINEIGLDNPYMKGNPNLKPEKVNTIDMGVNYLGEQIQGGVNYFFSKQSQIVFQDVSIDPGIYDNIGEVKFHGVEFEGKYYATKSLFITGSALYQINEDKDGNKNVTPIANFGAKGGISYKSEKGVTVSLFNIYQENLDEKYDTQLNPSPEAYNLMNLYCRFNMKKFFDWHIGQDISLLLQVDNLLNKEIWLPNWGLDPGTSIPVNQGREIYVGLNVSL